ncbi:MAG: M20/M25/M40 family metallo-hydrolase [Planctomycetes bacterium]|nr:M20/M25/M40 family metallo-hydrolase [Planctomycetota bacterium]
MNRSTMSLGALLAITSVSVNASAAGFAQEAAPAERGSAVASAATVAEPIAPLPADHPLQEALATITADDLRDYEKWLASDERMGRCAGEAGNDEAAEWIARQFDELGLAPLGDDGTFLQHFDFRVRGGEGGKMARTQNVVAFWEGSDPVLRQQVVVVGAHFDHVGTAKSLDAGRIGRATPADEIWNGADDNGSGTCTLIEVAEAFAQSGLKPKRSLVFIAFSAEEQGLFGSIHYCANPAIPIERTVAMLNMDMVGRNEGKPIEMAAIGTLQNDLWRALVAESHPAAPGLVLDLKNHYLPDSDHSSFIDAGVPTTFICTGLHEDYHKISDTQDKIAYDQMAQITRFATALLWNTANSEAKFVFEKPKFEPRGRGKKLGVTGEGIVAPTRLTELGLSKEQGGYEVNELIPDSVGSKAGLAVGDVILSIGGKALSSDDANVSLRRLIGGAPSKQDVAIVVLRGKEQVTLQARWE